MKLTPEMINIFEKLQLICDLKENLSPRDENERREFLFLLKMLKIEIENAEYTLNIIHNDKDNNREIIKEIIEQIKTEEGQEHITIKSFPVKTLTAGDSECTIDETLKKWQTRSNME